MAENVLHAEIHAETSGAEAVERLRQDTDRLSNAMRHLHAEEEHGAGTMHRFAEGLAIAAEHTEGLREHGYELRQILGEHVETIGELLPMLGALGAATSLTGLVEMTHEAAEARTQLNAMALTLGTTTGQLQGLQLAARETDVPIETMQTGMMRLARTMADAASGKNKQASEIFQRMGIALRDGHGHLKATADVLPQVAESLSRTTDSTLRSAVAMQLFGRSGAELIPLLNEGARGLEEFQAKSDKLNVGFSKEDNEKLEAFKNSWIELDTAVGGFKDEFLKDLGPALTPVISGMKDWLVANREWIATDVTADIKQITTSLNEVDWKGIGKDAGEVGHALSVTASAVGGWQVIIGGAAALAGLKIVLSAAKPVLELGKIGLEVSKLIGKLTFGLARAWDTVGEHAAAAFVKEHEAAAAELGGGGFGAGGAGGVGARHGEDAAGAATTRREEENTGSNVVRSRALGTGLTIGSSLWDAIAGGGRPLSVADVENHPGWLKDLTPDQRADYDRQVANQPRTAGETVTRLRQDVGSWLFGAGDGSTSGAAQPSSVASEDGARDGSVMVHVKIDPFNPNNTTASIVNTTGSARAGSVDVGRNYPMGYPTDY